MGGSKLDWGREQKRKRIASQGFEPFQLEAFPAPGTSSPGLTSVKLGTAVTRRKPARSRSDPARRHPRARDDQATGTRKSRIAHFLHRAVPIRKRLRRLVVMAGKKSSFDEACRRAVGVKSEVRRGMAEDRGAARQRPHPRAQELIRKFYAEIKELVGELESRGVLDIRSVPARKSRARRRGTKRVASRKR